MKLKTYLMALITFLVVDAIWLGLIAQPLYARQLGFLLTDSPNWVAAGIFYLFFVYALVFFVIEGNHKRPLVAAALFGAVTYATYDLTNLATIDGWPVMVTVIDIAWGALLAVLVTKVTLRVAVWR
jgi:uncharacterized membrane protein